MTSLKHLQDSFQKAMLEGDPSILSQIPDTPREKHDVLLGVYQYAYSARLMEFLENDFPQLHGYLGDEQFAQLCKAYIATNLSQTPNARWYGNKLPEFLANTAPYSEQVQLHELAKLEFSLNIVFDEHEETPMELPQLAQVAAEDWPALVFAPMSATRRLDLQTNVPIIWNALVGENTPPDVENNAETLHILVYRDGFQSSFRSMDYGEAMMWDKMAAGVPFGVLCELMATYGGEEEAAMRVGSFLHGWISSELIVDKFAPESNSAD